MNFNEKLINLRKSKGLSQEELGNELKVSRQTISKWESCQSYPDFQARQDFPQCCFPATIFSNQGNRFAFVGF